MAWGTMMVIQENTDKRKNGTRGIHLTSSNKYNTKY
jgi:hypothetical protein